MIHLVPKFILLVNDSDFTNTDLRVFSALADATFARLSALLSNQKVLLIYKDFKKISFLYLSLAHIYMLLENTCPETKLADARYRSGFCSSLPGIY